jgi:hypothetical protein
MRNKVIALLIMQTNRAFFRMNILLRTSDAERGDPCSIRCSARVPSEYGPTITAKGSL